MTDPDPADALASSQLQQEEEERAPRVEPLEAGVGGQDLPQRSQPAEVTAAERTNHEWVDERIRQAAENRANCGGSVYTLGAYWEGYAEGLKFARKIYESRTPDGDGDRSRTAIATVPALETQKVSQCDGDGSNPSDSHQPSERPPARSLAVDPADGIVAPRQRAADSPSDPDRGAALGRLPRERDALKVGPDTAICPHCMRGIAVRRLDSPFHCQFCGGTGVRASGCEPLGLRCQHLLGEEIESWTRSLIAVFLAHPHPLADEPWMRRNLRDALIHASTFLWADKIACQQELETLRADVARLRHLAHQLIEQWRASEKHSRDNLDFNSRHGNIQDDDYPNALKACADELDAALTEPPA